MQSINKTVDHILALCLQEKMAELQKQLSKLEGERAEMENRRTLLDSACRLRDEELSKVLKLSVVPQDHLTLHSISTTES